MLYSYVMHRRTIASFVGLGLTEHEGTSRQSLLDADGMQLLRELVAHCKAKSALLSALVKQKKQRQTHSPFGLSICRVHDGNRDLQPCSIRSSSHLYTRETRNMPPHNITGNAAPRTAYYSDSWLVLVVSRSFETNRRTMALQGSDTKHLY